MLFSPLASVALVHALPSAGGGGTLLRIPCSQIVVDRIEPYAL